MKLQPRAVFEFDAHVSHDFLWKALVVIGITTVTFIVLYCLGRVLYRIVSGVNGPISGLGQNAQPDVIQFDHRGHRLSWRNSNTFIENLILFVNCLIFGGTIAALAVGFYLVGFDIATAIPALTGLVGVAYFVSRLLSNIGSGIGNLLSGFVHIGRHVEVDGVSGVVAGIHITYIELVQLGKTPTIKFIEHSDFRNPRYNLDPAVKLPHNAAPRSRNRSRIQGNARARATTNQSRPRTLGDATKEMCDMV